MLQKTDDQSQVRAGLALLHSVALNRDPLTQFAEPAIDAVANLISRIGLSDHNAQKSLGLKALDVLTSIHDQTGRISNYPIEIDGSRTRRAHTSIKNFYGARIVTIKAYEIRSFRSGKQDRPQISRVKYVDCEIVGRAPKPFNFDKIEIEECIVSGMWVSRMSARLFSNNSFEKCDFSGAILSGYGTIPDMRAHGCFYKTGKPPIWDAQPAFAWNSVLTET